MKAIYIGNRGEPVPDTFEHHGVTFEKNIATPIPAELEVWFMRDPRFRFVRED